MWYQLILVLSPLLEAARQGDQGDQGEHCSSSPESACTWLSPSDYEKIGKVDLCSFEDVTAGQHADLKSIADFDAFRKTISEHGVQILTDLDDTLFCSGGGAPKAGVALAGVDAECEGTERHGLYPGVAEFYYAVALGSQTNVVLGETIATTVIPFSARPIVLNSGLQLIGRGIQQCKGHDLAIRKAICHGCQAENDCAEGKCNCFGLNAKAAEYGNLSNVRDIYSGNFMHMANLKFDAWKSNRFDKPTVFIGDTGQGDFSASQSMLVASQKIVCTSSSSCKGRVLAAFMHDVKKTCPAGKCREAWKKQNIFFFDDYGEAADQAKAAGLITFEARNWVQAERALALQKSAERKNKSAAQAPDKGYMASILAASRGIFLPSPHE